jgi:hypothetical protein
MAKSREETCWHCGGSGRYCLAMEPKEVIVATPPPRAWTSVHVVEIDCSACRGWGLVEVKETDE